MTTDENKTTSDTVEQFLKRKSELYFLLKQHYSNLSLLYAFACGERTLKKSGTAFALDGR